METSILTRHGQSYICAIDENECPSPHVESNRFMSLYCIADARAQTVSVSGPQQTSKPRVWDRMTLGRLLIGVCDVMYMYVVRCCTFSVLARKLSSVYSVHVSDPSVGGV